MGIRNRNAAVLLCSLAVALLLAAGCAPPVRPVPQDQQAAVFKPPTLVVSPVPTPTITIPPPRPTATVECANELKFLSDATIPDGTIVAPGSFIDKRWEVENSGTCSWDERYHLKLIDGAELDAASEQALFPARSGSQATLQVTFTAPEEPGTYRATWQAAGPDDEPFGDPFYIEFVVQSP